MRLGVLGHGSLEPHPLRGAPGFAVEGAGGTILLDLGPGSVRRWPLLGLGVADVKGACLTHFHVDHTSDLGYLLFLRRYFQPLAEGELLVIGPPGLGAFHAALHAAWGYLLEPRPAQAITLVEATSGAFGVAGLRVEALEVRHDPDQPALGFRIADGDRVLAYTGDTTFGPWLDPLLQGADLALVECSFPAGQANFRHLDASQAGRAASRAGVKRLGLVHLKGDVDPAELCSQAAAEFRGEVLVPGEGVWIEI